MTTSDAPRVAHLLRPAQGGMRELVRTLLLGDPNRPLLLAPADTLETLATAVPDPANRHLLSAESAAPHHQLAAGQFAGRWAKKNGATLLHGHGLRFAPLFASASLASGLPLVVTLHNLVPEDLTPMQKAAARAALSRAAAVIAVSDAVAESTAPLVPAADRIKRIYNGIDVARYAVAQEERTVRRNAMRACLGVPDGAPLTVCVSRLSPEKDVANVLEAAALAFPALPEALLYIVGEGRMLKTLEAQIGLLGLAGKAVLFGVLAHDRIPDLLFAADIFALGSREEGLSLAAIEASAAGVPVVATNVGGLPEAVAAGQTGVLVPARDPASFASALTELCGDAAKRSALGSAGRERVQRLFTQEAMSAATHDLYRRVAAR